MLGGLGAGTLASLLPEIALTRFLGAFLAAIAVILLTRWQPPAQRRHPEAAGTTALALGAGLLSGLAGIAGGNIIVPTLIFFNISPVRAAAQSSALGVPVALAGALGYAVLPSLPVLAPRRSLPAGSGGLAVGAMISAPQGVHLAHRVPALAAPGLRGAAPRRRAAPHQQNPLGPLAKTLHIRRGPGPDGNVGAAPPQATGVQGLALQSDDPQRPPRRDRRCVGLTARRSEAHCAGPAPHSSESAPPSPEPPAPPAPRREPAEVGQESIRLPALPGEGPCPRKSVPQPRSGQGGQPQGCQLAGAAQRAQRGRHPVPPRSGFDAAPVRGALAPLPEGPPQAFQARQRPAPPPGDDLRSAPPRPSGRSRGPAGPAPDAGLGDQSRKGGD